MGLEPNGFDLIDFHNGYPLYAVACRKAWRRRGPAVRVLPTWLGPGRLRLALGLALGATVLGDRRALQGPGVPYSAAPLGSHSDPAAVRSVPTPRVDPEKQGHATFMSTMVGNVVHAPARTLHACSFDAAP